MTAALLFVSIALAGMVVILLSNWRALPTLPAGGSAGDSPFVSVMIPARNEAENIASTVRKLLRQSYPRFELIVLDDDSDDGTYTAAQECAAGDSRLRVLQGKPIPPGWLGKNWACQQLAAQAQGEILVFTDADVQWEHGALAALLCEFERSEADTLAVFPTQRTVSWAERLCVPLMAFVIHTYLPILCVHYTPFPYFAAANGQCIAFSRWAYDRLGGHASVRSSVLEDVGLARQAKRRGLRLRLAEAGCLITCRMYRDWRSVREGYAKNILDGFGGGVGLLAGAVFHWVVFLAPWLPLWRGFANQGAPGHSLWALLLICAGILLRALTAVRSGQRVLDALLLPVSVLLMTCVAAQALWWRWRYGGPMWKGRRAIP